MKILRSIFDIIVTLMVIIAIILTIFSFNIDDKGLVDLNGTYFIPITNQTMKPSYNTNDLLIGKATTIKSLKTGDVVVYAEDVTKINIIKIARVTNINTDTILVKQDSTNTSTTVKSSNIIAKASTIKIILFGYFVSLLSSKTGFLVGIVLPLLLLFFILLFKFAFNISRDKKKKDDKPKDNEQVESLDTPNESSKVEELTSTPQEETLVTNPEVSNSVPTETLETPITTSPEVESLTPDTAAPSVPEELEPTTAAPKEETKDDNIECL